MDSRRFPSLHLPSLADFHLDPCVDDTLQFDIPPFSQYNGWTLTSRYMAWSPNSTVKAFLPGIPPPTFLSTPAVNPSQRRFDGSLGRFDWTVAPQLVGNRFWRALCLRPRIGYGRRQEFPEYESLTNLWISKDRDVGRIAPEYISRLQTRLADLDSKIAACSPMRGSYVQFWDSRPRDPSPAAIGALSHITRWADAVDTGVAVQRDIKEKAAWLEFASRLRTESWNTSLARVQNSGVPPAHDVYLGAWINGGRKSESLWLLAQGVPVFIAHRLEPEEIYHDSSLEPDTHRKWWEGTDAEDLQDDRYPYDQVAIRNQSVQAAARPYPYTLRPSSVAPAFHHASFPRNQRWRGPLIGYSASAPPPSPARRTPSPLTLPAEEASEPQIKPRCEAAPLEYVPVHPDREPWIKPPPLFDNRRPGQWTKWVTDDWVVCTQVGKKSSDPDNYEYCLYDRDNQRRIHFDTIPDPPSGAVSDSDVFGRPAPRARFVGLHGDVRISRWLYPSEYPAP
ncbi:hypothetical protein LshimejAT787_2400310 [Lyophyllum shimeji]|uniref:Uncharacterized protein n=1 Tax=Lyophyllum shimeji TaxID=47721 RepID=A0A9P3Q1V0_LYOSH|nr:hypothetical protein LshimejAT787_2400310 [Lyophyllum shimeji]